MKKLSAIVITFNEEENIGRCLKSFQGIAEEVIVVDSFSTDRTSEIIKEFGALCIQHAFNGYIEQKNYALSQAKYDFVLSLDADEALSPELYNAILEEKKSDLSFVGYKMNRLTFIGNRAIRCCGWYPDTKIRLFNRLLGEYAGLNPHDEFRFHKKTNVKHLSGDLLHYSFKSTSEVKQQTQYFAKISAEAYAKWNKKTIPFSSVISPAFRFARDYFLNGGFLHGVSGFKVSYYNAFGTWLKYRYFKEIKRNHHKNKKNEI